METQVRHNDVLFQKLGNVWYIFAEIDNELVYSTMPDGMDPYTTKLELYEVIEDHMEKVSKIQKKKHSGEAAA
ncbi:MAG: hypothetical protein CME69_05385 [Halobacteriovorax sp.]|nr:hypothetical protein [Halobacteriovorax sp.]MEE3079281.1 hypothetical protein [Bdellovibrionota bacterium]